MYLTNRATQTPSSYLLLLGLVLSDRFLPCKVHIFPLNIHKSLGFTEWYAETHLMWKLLSSEFLLLLVSVENRGRKCR